MEDLLLLETFYIFINIFRICVCGEVCDIG